MSEALVLSGGNIKGAYQAGAIEQILQQYTPKIITGISVGALNTAFLASYGDELGPLAGHHLTDFWESEITSPKAVVRKRNVIELAYRFLFKKWDGVVDMSRMEKLVRAELGSHFPAVGELIAAVGATNLVTGELVYTDSKDASFMDAVFASTAEPIVMPLRMVRGEPYYDGGLRDITPLKHAIDLGATRIVMVLCQPEHDLPMHFKPGDFMALADDVMGIVTNEIIKNDIEVFTGINDLIRKDYLDGRTAGKRYIPLTVIRPAQAINVNITNFTTTDIKNMIELGRQDAFVAMAQAGAAGAKVAA